MLLFVSSIIASVLYNKIKYYPENSTSCILLDELPTDRQIIVFASGGGYWTYYMGIAKFMQETYVLDDINFVGASAGAFCSNVLANKLTVDDSFFTCLNFLDKLNTHFTGTWWNWVLVSKDVSLDTMNFYKCNLHNNRRVFSSVTQLTSKGLIKKYFTCGESYESIIDSMITSYWIPFITAPFFQPFSKINGQYYIDGFLSGPEKINKQTTLVIHPHIFERLPFYTHWLWLGRDYNIWLFNRGYEQAKMNRHKLDKFLHNWALKVPNQHHLCHL
jgi:hypothetical protein